MKSFKTRAVSVALFFIIFYVLTYAYVFYIPRLVSDGGVLGNEDISRDINTVYVDGYGFEVQKHTDENNHTIKVIQREFVPYGAEENLSKARALLKVLGKTEQMIELISDEDLALFAASPYIVSSTSIMSGSPYRRSVSVRVTVVNSLMSFAISYTTYRVVIKKQNKKDELS